MHNPWLDENKSLAAMDYFLIYAYIIYYCLNIIKINQYSIVFISPVPKFLGPLVILVKQQFSAADLVNVTREITHFD